jgi:hypothetical protein
MSPKRVALWCLIVSVAASALLGIVIVLAGSFSDVQVRIILTTLTISSMSICALAAGALWETKRLKFLSLAGATLAVVAALVFIVGIWTKTSSEEFWKFSASLGIVAVATAHVCLLSLARLAGAFALARLLAFVAVYLLVIQFIYIIYWQPKGDTFVRIVGANSIIVAAFSILIPIFHRLNRKEMAEQSGAGRVLFPTISCPQCGASQPNSSTEIVCAGCGCHFLMTIVHSGAAPAATKSS